MNIFPEVRNDIDVRAAVEGELASLNRMLPPRWGDLSLKGHEEAVSTWFRSLVRRDFTVQHEDVLLARKLGRGARPLSVLGLQERLLYRGVVAIIEAVANTSENRTFEAYSVFQEAPMEVEHCQYVLKADIAAYYQYIDHERLVDEVVAQTGDDLAASVVVDLLREASGRAYGLPQANVSSDVLAEIYIQPMQRALIRSGFTSFRFADDFRVACRTYAEALAAWEAADSAARELGLVLNEGKTSTRLIEGYIDDITSLRDQEQQLFDDLDIEELEADDYFDLDGEEEMGSVFLLDQEDSEEGEEAVASNTMGTYLATPGPTQVLAANKVMDRWLEDQDANDDHRADTGQVSPSLLKRALQVLADASEPQMLQHVTPMLVYRPSLTPTISRYMIRCIEHDRERVVRALDEICQSRVLNAWQSTWMSFVAGSIPRRRRNRINGSNLPHVEWLKEQIRNANSSLAGEAILALARRRLVSIEQVNAVLGRLTPVQRPIGIIALAALGDIQVAQKAAPSAIDRIRVDWAAEHL